MCLLITEGQNGVIWERIIIVFVYNMEDTRTIEYFKVYILKFFGKCS